MHYYVSYKRNRRHDNKEPLSLILQCRMLDYDESYPQHFPTIDIKRHVWSKRGLVIGTVENIIDHNYI